MNSRQLVKFALCFTGIKSINVAIKRTVKIGKLSGLSPFPNPIFIHLGNVLQPSTSFEFNNICNGDTIFACPSSSKNITSSISDNKSWIQLTDTIDYLCRKQCQEENIHLERLRLQDLYLSKLEFRKNNYYSQLIHKMLPNEEEDHKIIPSTKIISQPSLSTTPLPKIW